MSDDMVADTAANGTRSFAVQRDTAGRWWACNVPYGHSYTLRSTGVDSASTMVRFRIRPGVELAVVGSLHPAERNDGLIRETAASLTVVVLDSLSSAPLADARVSVDGRTARTNGDGRARIALGAVTPHRLSVTRIGYSPRDTVVDASLSGRDVTLRLAHHVTAITEVRINGKVVHAPARFAGVLLRAAMGTGSFFSQDDFAGGRDLKSVLAAVPGAQVNDRGVTFLRCKADLSGPAKVQVYIDGLWLNTHGDNVTEALRSVHPRDIAFVEVYDGVTRIPAEFMSDACAVIAIWTRSY